MTDAARPARRRGHYLLPAAIVALTALGATAIARGAFDEPAPMPPLSTPVAAPPSPDATQDSTAPDVLTTGPLMDTSRPTAVSIPALKVSAPIIGLGQQADGSMQVPDDERTVGWYTKAPTPGALGPAVLAGHVDLNSRPGAFAELAALEVGDQVNVDRADGSMAMFAVTKIERYPKNKFPSATVYGAIDHAGLRLITCGGTFDTTSGHYEDNIVVYAALKHSHPA